MASALSRAPLWRLGPEGPTGRCASAARPEPVRWPSQPQRPPRCSGLRGQSPRSGPELWGRLPPQVLSTGNGARRPRSRPEVRAHPPHQPSRAHSRPSAKILGAAVQPSLEEADKQATVSNDEFPLLLRRDDDLGHVLRSSLRGVCAFGLLKKHQVFLILKKTEI